jgi:hypothetical protein
LLTFGAAGVEVQFRANEIGIIGAMAVAVALGGCANLDDNKDAWFAKPFQFVSRNGGYSFSELQESKQRTRPITTNDLVAANGSCPPPPVQQAAAPPVQQAAAAPAANQPGSAPAASDTGTLLGGGIALGMSECDVVFRAGAPNNVQIGKNPNGDRTAVLTFSGGPRAGIYHFQSGALMEVERGETAPAATQTAKKKPSSPPKTSSKQPSSKQAAKE